MKHRRRWPAHHSPVCRPAKRRVETHAEEDAKLRRRQRITRIIRYASHIGRLLWPHRHAILHWIVVAGHKIGPLVHLIAHKLALVVLASDLVIEQRVHEIVAWLRHIAHVF